MYMRNLDEKMNNPLFLSDMDEIIRPDLDYDPYTAYETVKNLFVQHI